MMRSDRRRCWRWLVVHRARCVVVTTLALSLCCEVAHVDEVLLGRPLNFESSKWVPLGWRRTFEDTAELVPHVVIEPSTVLHFGVVVCRSKSRQEAELAFASGAAAVDRRR